MKERDRRSIKGHDLKQITDYSSKNVTEDFPHSRLMFWTVMSGNSHNGSCSGWGEVSCGGGEVCFGGGEVCFGRGGLLW